MNSFLCAATASALSLLSAYLFTHFSVLQLPQFYRSCWLNQTSGGLQTNPSAMLFLWYFHSVFHTLAWPEIFFLCSTVCLEQSPFQSLVIKHTHIFQTIFEISPLQAVLLTLCVCVCTLFRLVTLQWAMCSNSEQQHIIKRVRHYYVRLFLTILPLLVANSSTRDGFVYSLWSCEFWGVFF